MDVRANLGLTWIDHSKDFGFKKKNHPKMNGKCAHIGRGLQEATSLEGPSENVTEAAE